MMNVSLRPAVQKFVEDKVKTGEYPSPEAAVNALLSRARQEEKLTPRDVEELRAEINRGIKESNRGEFVEFTAEEIIAERRAARAARKKVC